MANYPNSIPSFTSKSAGQTIQPNHVNDLQDEVVAIGTDLLKAWTSVAYSAGNFTASAGSWTVDVGDQLVYAYIKHGKKMTVAFEINTTDVTASPATLFLAIPGGFVSAKQISVPILAINAGSVISTALAQVAASGTAIGIYRDLVSTAWTTTSGDNTYVLGEITFETTT